MAYTLSSSSPSRGPLSLLVSLIYLLSAFGSVPYLPDGTIHSCFSCPRQLSPPSPATSYGPSVFCQCFDDSSKVSFSLLSSILPRTIESSIPLKPAFEVDIPFSLRSSSVTKLLNPNMPDSSSFSISRLRMTSLSRLRSWLLWNLDLCLLDCEAWFFHPCSLMPPTTSSSIMFSPIPFHAIEGCLRVHSVQFHFIDCLSKVLLFHASYLAR